MRACCQHCPASGRRRRGGRPVNLSLLSFTLFRQKYWPLRAGYAQFLHCRLILLISRICRRSQRAAPHSGEYVIVSKRRNRTMSYSKVLNKCRTLTTFLHRPTVSSESGTLPNVCVTFLLGIPTDRTGMSFSSTVGLQNACLYVLCAKQNTLDARPSAFNGHEFHIRTTR